MKKEIIEYMARRRVQILHLVNSRLEYCNSHQINFKEDIRIIQLGLESKVLRDIQKVCGITDLEIIKKVTENEKNVDKS